MFLHKIIRLNMVLDVINKELKHFFIISKLAKMGKIAKITPNW